MHVCTYSYVERENMYAIVGQFGKSRGRREKERE
jgi:hypothetical protein